MILVDSNLLIYAHHLSFSQHVAARTWLDEQLSGATPVGLPWMSLLDFLRVSTNPKAFGRPERIETAWQQVSAWLSNPVVWIPQPTERHADVLGELLKSSRAFGNLVPDAHLAALAIEHGLTVCSADSDFGRFPNLRWKNPLTG